MDLMVTARTNTVETLVSSMEDKINAGIDCKDIVDKTESTTATSKSIKQSPIQFDQQPKQWTNNISPVKQIPQNLILY